MTSVEGALLKQLRALAIHPAARGFKDDAAVLEVGGETLILTHDVIVEGVHFLPNDPPSDIGWKLAAVNLSDLAAKGADPIACLMGYSLSGDKDWDAAFLNGLGEALEQFAMPLIGGDTVAVPDGSARQFGLTAIGRAEGSVPTRGGAKPGDTLFVTGSIGLAGLGLELAKAERSDDLEAITAYRRPQPHVTQGRALAGRVHAMMDVSDGLLLDASRMAEASGLGVVIDTVPMVLAVASRFGNSVESALAAATAGDDYVLLFAGSAELAGFQEAVPVGYFTPEPGLCLKLDGNEIALPESLGFEHF